MNNDPSYNPLDKRNLGHSVSEAMLSREIIPLDKIDKFTGAGIYAIYYSGGFHAYRAIVRKSLRKGLQTPIYVGKADPPGARKGNFGLEVDPGPALHKRLKEHATSIRQTSTLEVSDFCCRYLVVDDIWISLGESLLIAQFSPIWNKIVDGFGNHATGSGRYQQVRSRWDTLHPGRKWAEKCKVRPETANQIMAEIRSHLEAAPHT